MAPPAGESVASNSPLPKINDIKIKTIMTWGKKKAFPTGVYSSRFVLKRKHK